METYKQKVIKIEQKSSDKGPFKEVSIEKKDGTIKVKKVFGDVAAKFTVPGIYENSYAKQESGVFFLVDAKLAGAPTGSAGTGVTRVEGEKNRSIQAQCSIKAASVVLQGYAAGGMTPDDLLALIPKVAHSFMEAVDKIDAPLPKKEQEIEEVPF